MKILLLVSKLSCYLFKLQDPKEMWFHHFSKLRCLGNLAENSFNQNKNVINFFHSFLLFLFSRRNKHTCVLSLHMFINLSIKKHYMLVSEVTNASKRRTLLVFNIFIRSFERYSSIRTSLFHFLFLKPWRILKHMWIYMKQMYIFYFKRNNWALKWRQHLFCSFIIHNVYFSK